MIVYEHKKQIFLKILPKYLINNFLYFLNKTKKQKIHNKNIHKRKEKLLKNIFFCKTIISAKQKNNFLSA